MRCVMCMIVPVKPASLSVVALLNRPIRLGSNSIITVVGDKVRIVRCTNFALSSLICAVPITTASFDPLRNTVILSEHSGNTVSIAVARLGERIIPI